MMSVKKMIETYLTYGVQEDTWNMMYHMTCHGLISQDNWRKFYETCKGWYVSEDGNAIMDSTTETTVYIYDDNGNLVKA